MGLRDAAEQLEACKEESVRAEHRIADLEEELGRVEREVPQREAAFRTRIAELEAAFDLERQALTEAEAENVRLESALAQRLQHDGHGVAALEDELRHARRILARIFRLVDPRKDDPAPLTPRDVRRILDDVTAEPEGAYLDPGDALTAGRAVRALAGVIRATSWDFDGDQDHADADVLDALADRIGAPPA
jgi:hypothetical protein